MPEFGLSRVAALRSGRTGRSIPAAVGNVIGLPPESVIGFDRNG